MTFHVPEEARIIDGPIGSTSAYGNNGAFYIKLTCGQYVGVIASDGEGWEHVSVSREDRVPTWDEMCQIKDLFWDDSDCVMQLHPPKEDYVNDHSYCLHLWRPIWAHIPQPETWMV